MKRFSRKLTRDYQSYEFSTQLDHTIQVGSGDELQIESDKLFQQAKALTEEDIEKTMGEIHAANG